MKLTHLRQVALGSSDLRKSTEFYRDILGVELLAEFPPNLVFFRLGGTRLLLEGPSSASNAGGVLYFEVSDIHAAHAELEQRGVTFDSAPHVIHRDAAGTFGPAGGEEWMAFFRDPDGNILALAAFRLPT